MENLSRRTFAQGASLAVLAAAGTGAVGSLYGCSSDAAPEPAASEEKIIWNTCTGPSNYGCGAVLCPLQFHVVDGQIKYVESDNVGDSSFGGLQARACLRGRSIRRLINHPDRLHYPMKRVGKRGEGEFEQISWDEAIELFYEKLKYVIDTYGNEAVHRTQGGPSNGGPFARLMNLIGGHLDSYGSDSCGQIGQALPMLYGWVDFYPSAPLIHAEHADILLMFGNSPADTAMGGGAACYDLARVRESGTKIYNFDYRMNESLSSHPDEWVPIMNGTDAALASAISYVLITEGYANEEFLHTYCIGYDEQTMPEGAPTNASYRDYILGTGYDMVAKTPEWASPITRVPVDKIYEIAREVGKAQTVFVTQGWGPQRHSNGENACRAIAMIAIMTGNLGKLGTNTGQRDMRYTGPVPEFSEGIPSGSNPVTTSISCVHRFEVIERGPEMTALRDGVRGKDKLDTGVKFLLMHDVNLFNQSVDVNHTHDILVDESLCEFITVVDVVMTPTCKYADLIIPDVIADEKHRIRGMLTGGAMEGVIFAQPVQEPQFECRDDYEFYAAVAEKFGVKEQYTEGRTWQDWQLHLYEQARAERPDLPTAEEGYEMGIWKQAFDAPVPLANFINDPVNAPLSTPSGKIEIYSSDLAKAAATWELDDPRDIISPIPIYNPGTESYEDVTEEYPMVLSGWHPKHRSHSSFGGVELLKDAVRQQVWINPIDAEPRGISNGDKVRVFNERGEIHIEARVTPRILPGVIAAPEGAWLDADMNGDRICKGGNVNVLTGRHWSPYAKHNSSHNAIAQIEKL